MKKPVPPPWTVLDSGWFRRGWTQNRLKQSAPQGRWVQKSVLRERQEQVTREEQAQGKARDGYPGVFLQGIPPYIAFQKYHIRPENSIFRNPFHTPPQVRKLHSGIRPRGIA